jgi:hypothetical protein
VHGVTLIKSAARKVKKGKKPREEDRYMQNRFLWGSVKLRQAPRSDARLYEDLSSLIIDESNTDEIS